MKRYIHILIQAEPALSNIGPQAKKSFGPINFLKKNRMKCLEKTLNHLPLHTYLHELPKELPKDFVEKRAKHIYIYGGPQAGASPQRRGYKTKMLTKFLFVVAEKLIANFYSVV